MSELQALLNALITALDSGMEVTITVKKPVQVKTTVTCSDCGWTQDYGRPDNASAGLKRHFRHCTARKRRLNGAIPQWLVDQTTKNEGEK